MPEFDLIKLEGATVPDNVLVARTITRCQLIARLLCHFAFLDSDQDTRRGYIRQKSSAFTTSAR
jgi:hypothetical protein